jgi:hypothetical protein
VKIESTVLGKPYKMSLRPNLRLQELASHVGFYSPARDELVAVLRSAKSLSRFKLPKAGLRCQAKEMRCLLKKIDKKLREGARIGMAVTRIRQLNDQLSDRVNSSTRGRCVTWWALASNDYDSGTEPTYVSLWARRHYHRNGKQVKRDTPLHEVNRFVFFGSINTAERLLESGELLGYALNVLGESKGKSV